MRHPMILIALVGATTAGCGHFQLALDRCPATRVTSTEKAVVHYLGTGGYLVTVGRTSVLLGPHFTNPSVLEVAFDAQIRTDGSLIEALLPREADKASAILVGHSHYDHLMDVPYVALRRAQNARIYGSSTTVNLLHSIGAALGADRQVVALDDYAGDFLPEKLTPAGLRILPIRSEHSDQAVIDLPLGLARWPLHLFRGEVTEPRSELPDKASGWAEGKVFAYLIDFLNERGESQFRVYYQDSGANPPLGLIPWNKAGSKKVDVVLICAGGETDRLVRHPEAVIEDAKPRYVVMGHWEDLFRTQRSACDEPKKRDRKVHAIPVSHFNKRQLIGDTATEHFQHRAQKALDRVGGESVFLPCPSGSRFELPLSGDPSRPIDAEPINICPALGVVRD